MGYSGRYHAASLAAVFIALAVGILIGIGLADDVVSSASEELETSLRSDLSDAQDRADELQGQLDRGDRFSEAVLTPLLENRLFGQKVALVELGAVSEHVVDDSRSAVETAGGDLSAVVRIARPPDVDELLDDLPPQLSSIRRQDDQLEQLGEAVGTGIARDGPIVEALKPALFESFAGDLRNVDQIIVSRADTEGLNADERDAVNAFEQAIVEGIDERAAATVGVELSDQDPSTLAPFVDAGLATVDDIDLPAGQVSLVFALDGVDGNFGIKEQARSFLPDFGRQATVGSP